MIALRAAETGYQDQRKIRLDEQFLVAVWPLCAPGGEDLQCVQLSPTAAAKNQKERRAKPARRSSRFIYPKTAARRLHQSRSVHKNQNPQNGQHRARFDWGFGAVCFGASPVAAVFGSAPRSATSTEHRIHSKPTPRTGSSKQDISTLLGIGHFYFALTVRKRALLVPPGHGMIRPDDASCFPFGRNR